MPVTIQNVVQDALGIIGEVTGIGTQTYSEPRMVKDAGRGFNLLFKKRFWEQYTRWTTVTLDGVTGTPTTGPFGGVAAAEDFGMICKEGFNYPLPILPTKVNPKIIKGTEPLYWNIIPAGAADFKLVKIRVYPITSVGNLDVMARYHPNYSFDTGDFSEWSASDLLELDRDLLAYGCAFMALTGDDLNTVAASTVQGMMDMRYKDIIHSLSDYKISLGPAGGSVPRDWFTLP